MVQYDTNVQAVMEFLSSEDYSASVISLHRICYRKFRDYLLENGMPYSRPVADEWLDSNKSKWKYRTSTGYAHCIDQLDDVYQIGRVSEVHTGPHKAPYSLLDTTLKNELDEYLEVMAASDSSSSVTEERRTRCARFMLYLQEHGIHSLSEADYPDVMSFHKEDSHRSYKSKDIYEDEARALLKYGSDIGKCPIGLSLVLNKLLIDQVITDPGFIGENTYESTEELSWDTVLDFLSGLRDTGYSKTVMACSKHTLTLLFLFFDMHGLPFSEKSAWDWFDTEKPLLKANWKQARRTLNQFFAFLDSKEIITSFTGDRDAKTGMDLLPAWCRDQLQDFLDLLHREGRAESTITMYRSSIVRFCRYLESVGIDSFRSITAEDLVKFNMQDIHETTEGKAAYNCRIRNFLIYLEEEGLLDNSCLYRAIPTLSAPKVRVVKILEDEDVQKIWNKQVESPSPLYLRDYAIVCIGLGMGIRASDIVNLRFGDIDWEHRCFNFIQQKTGKAATLPFPVHVGNALFRYLKEGRPNSKSPYLFICHKTPYGKLGRTACCKALHRILPEMGDLGGFHVTRRTFATNLLRNETKVTMISESLGHRTDTAVHKYLSLDEDRMRICPLSLQEAGIPVEGGGSFA